ncbi:hypothetical protein [Corynebacterium mayonis]|uniref:hypothetical protein n=1 Tax=Corynebacterium mayonis TaxID=3062461 RepID=UPI0031408D0C
MLALTVKTGRYGPETAITPNLATSLADQVRTVVNADTADAVFNGFGLIADAIMTGAVATAGLVTSARESMEPVAGTVRYSYDNDGSLTYSQ